MQSSKPIRTAQALVVIVGVGALTLAAPARADDVDEARRENQKGMAAFALGNYAEAAQHYERAFALKPDPALLYNAAQSQRLAGNKQRALLLYENLERLFPAQQLRNRGELDRHISDLRAAIESETKTKGPPQTTAKPNLESGAAAAPQSPSASSTPAQPTAPAAAVTATPQQHDDRATRPLAKKPWFWAVIGGSVVAVGLAVGLGVGLSHPANPSPSLGAVTVH